MLKKLVIAAFLMATVGIAASVTVRQGDTLGSLALRYNTSVATLMKLNRLTAPKLKIGQELRLPDNATVTVQAGDTLEGLAARLGVSVASLQRANNLSSDALRVNQTLRLPSSSGGSSSSSASNITASSSTPKITSAPTGSSKTVVYTVRAGDTLGEIASRFKVSVAAIQSANGLRGDALSLGQQLRIPTVQATTSAATGKPVAVKPAVTQPRPNATVTKPSSTVAKPSTAKPIAARPSGIVIVQRSDTLSSIARASGSSIATLRQLNNLTSDALALGQRIRTTATASSATTKPVVKPASSAAATPKPSAVKPTVSSVAAKPVIVSKPVTVIPAPAAMDSSAVGVMPTAPSDVLEDQTDYRIVEPINPPAQINRSERLLWPISGILTSRYGYRWGRLHTGLDIAVPTGTAVYAALSGTVQFAGWNRFGYGHLVVIRGVDSRLYYYAHNSRLLVSVGQFVPQGRMISKSGSTGNSTGPHLHFEVRVGGVARNPLAYLPSSQVLQARYAGR